MAGGCSFPRPRTQPFIILSRSAVLRLLPLGCALSMASSFSEAVACLGLSQARWQLGVLSHSCPHPHSPILSSGWEGGSVLPVKLRPTEGEQVLVPRTNNK